MIKSIVKKELYHYFFSPIAWVVTTLFLALTGWLTFSTYFLYGQVDMVLFFTSLPYILAFTMPALSMSLFAEEYKSGSYEGLQTLPCTHGSIIIGKFIALMISLIAMLALTLIYPLLISLTGDLDIGPVISAYLGTVLLGASFGSIGLFFSSKTKNQIIAFIASLSFSLFLSLVGNFLVLLPSWLETFCQALSASSHFQAMINGIIDTRDLLYFFSIIGLAFMLIRGTGSENDSFTRVRYTLIFVIVLLLNLWGNHFYTTFDLSQNKVNTLSTTSKDLIDDLQEPLSIRVYLSPNLPSPYSGLEEDLRNLLESYSRADKGFFNYSITLIDESSKNQDLLLEQKQEAEGYGINSIQIQDIKEDKVSLVNAWMGLAVVYGERQMALPVIDPSSNLEYALTTTIRKLTEQNNKLLSLNENIQVQLLLSEELKKQSDFLNYSSKLQSQIDELNKDWLGRLDFSNINPSNLAEIPESWQISALNLRTKEGEDHQVWAAILLKKDDKTIGINIVGQGLLGVEITTPEELKDQIADTLPSLLGIKPSIAYLADHGTPPLYYNSYIQNSTTPLTQLNQALSQTYSPIPVTLSDGSAIPQGVQTLIIAGDKEPFTDWELYQIDQFVMGGGALALFHDPFQEILPSQAEMQQGQAPKYEENITGIMDLMAHYGLNIDSSVVLDHENFTQLSQSQGGGITETALYFAPRIKQFNDENPITEGLQELITLNNAPLLLEESDGMSVLFSSSDQAWLMKDNINLYDPRMIIPPIASQGESYPLAALKQGAVTSYFADKAIPHPPQQEGINTSQLGTPEALLSNPDARIFLMGSSQVLQDALLAEGNISLDGKNFVLNLVDTLSGRPGDASMRSKGLSYTMQKSTSSALKSFIKTTGMFTIPLLSIFGGVFTWSIWRRRKRRIAELFQGEEK